MHFGFATSACLSISDYLSVLDSRMKKIIDYSPKSRDGIDARNFLDERVIPKIEELKAQTLEKVSNDAPLPADKQVLTPADYGFHNILVNGENYTFIDFEYFGRDDPARQMLDFLHHDKSREIAPRLISQFLERYNSNMKIKGFRQRLEILDPLVGMAWCLIYLNVLSQDYLSYVNLDSREIVSRLEKAKNKLENLRYFKI
jgi:thiamine kinase-like enzyme